MRDQRFVAVHRGGSLSKDHQRLLISWATDCTEHVLAFFEDQHIDDRLHHALNVARVWATEEVSVGDARNASVGAIAVARELTNPASIALARAIGHAVATAHMADHSIKAADYALKVVKVFGESIELERQWQDDQLPTDIRELVISARHTPELRINSSSSLNHKLRLENSLDLIVAASVTGD